MKIVGNMGGGCMRLGRALGSPLQIFWNVMHLDPMIFKPWGRPWLVIVMSSLLIDNSMMDRLQSTCISGILTQILAHVNACIVLIILYNEFHSCTAVTATCLSSLCKSEPYCSSSQESWRNPLECAVALTTSATTRWSRAKWQPRRLDRVQYLLVCFYIIN